MSIQTLLKRCISINNCASLENIKINETQAFQLFVPITTKVFHTTYIYLMNL